MPVYGPNSPTSIVNTPVATNPDWLNPGNAADNDAAYATSTVNNQSTDHLDATTFGFAVGAGETITKVKVEIERKVDTTLRTPDDKTVQLIVSGAAAGDNNQDAAAQAWSTSDTYAVYDPGGNWANVLTPAIVNGTDFGVRFQVGAGPGGATIFSVDHVRITITTPDVVTGGLVNWLRRRRR